MFASKLFTKCYQMPSFIMMLALIYLVMPHFQQQPHFAEACSSRTVPKPRPSTTSSSSIAATAAPTTTSTTTATTTTSTTQRPNITFPTYKCAEQYDAWYCLNEATCFSVKIGESIMYNCECANGFMGPRCEYKELDGSFLPKRPRPMLEEAGNAGGVILALLFMLFLCLTLYMCYDQKSTSKFFGGGALPVDASASDTRCRYCSEKCCNDEPSREDLEQWRRRGGAASGGISGFARQQFEAMPMRFAIKRTTKM